MRQGFGILWCVVLLALALFASDIQARGRRHSGGCSGGSCHSQPQHQAHVQPVTWSSAPVQSASQFGSPFVQTPQYSASVYGDYHAAQAYQQPQQQFFSNGGCANGNCSVRRR